MKTPTKQKTAGTLARRSLVVVFMIAAALLLGVETRAATYYVGPIPGTTPVNSPSNGTLANPWRTLTYACSKLQPGDTLMVAGARYREGQAVQPPSGTASAPISVQAYDPSSPPDIYGTTVLTSTVGNVSGTWIPATEVGANVYKLTLPMTLDRNTFQVFVDGTPLTYAQFPAPVSGTDINHPNKDTVALGGNSNGTSATFVPTTSSSKDITGATIHISLGSLWMQETHTVTAYDASQDQITIDLADTNSSYQVRPGNTYFLTGQLQFLTGPGQWFYDNAGPSNPGTNQLYIWLPQSDRPDSPAYSGSPYAPLSHHVIEVKTQQWGLDLSDRQYVQISGIGLFACSLKTDAIDTSSTPNPAIGTQHVTVSGMRARYVAHFGNDNQPRSGDGNGNYYPTSSTACGLILDGANNEIKGSEVSYSAGYGIVITGNTNTVDNNYVHNVCYMGSWAGGIGTGSNPTTSPTISQNTVTVSGHRLITLDHVSGGEVNLNDVSNGGLQCRDIGGIYCAATQGGNCRIDHNVIHDMINALPPYQAPYGVATNAGTDNDSKGIYLDNGSGFFTVDHNLTYGVECSLILNSVCSRIGQNQNQSVLVYNNTLDGTKFSIGWDYTVEPDCVFQNNVGTNVIKTGIRNNDVDAANVASASASNFVNVAAHDYTPNTSYSSSLIYNKGVSIPGITDNVTDGYPDIGAFEAGQTAWSAGSKVQPAF